MWREQRGGPRRADRTREEETCGPAPGLTRLGELQPGATGIIRRLSCRGKLRRRLMDLGMVSGTPFEIVRVAPLGDPVEIQVKGIHLSLRREEAGGIWVEVPDDGG